ncbi:hypothetical protein D3C72_1791950 [compost metagenome]
MIVIVHWSRFFISTSRFESRFRNSMFSVVTNSLSIVITTLVCNYCKVIWVCPCWIFRIDVEYSIIIFVISVSISCGKNCPGIASVLMPVCNNVGKFTFQCKSCKTVCLRVITCWDLGIHKTRKTN